MTVCIAAICDFLGTPFVLVSSDRMITAGDIQYEPWQTKSFQLGPKIVALIAGDLVPQSAICKATFLEFQGKGNASVLDVAKGYAGHLVKHLRERNVGELLSPIGLSLKDFHKNLAKGNTEFVKETLERFYSSELGTETIIAGTDALGPHIYKVIDPTGEVETHDDVGFAAIGEGAGHAESQFMQMAYSRTWVVPWALFLTYLAMRRSQIAPSVGKEIDLYMIGPQNIAPLTADPFFGTLTGAYNAYEAQERAARATAFKVVADTFAELLKSGKEEEPPQAETKADDNQEGVSGGAEEGEPPRT